MFPGVLDWRVCATRFRLDCLAARFRGGARGWWLAYSPSMLAGVGALAWLVASWFRLAVVGLQRAGVFLFSGWVCWRLLAAGVAPRFLLVVGTPRRVARCSRAGVILPVGGWWLAVGCSLDGWRALSPRGCCWIAVGTVLVGCFLHGAVSLVGGWHSPPGAWLVRRGSGVGWFAGSRRGWIAGGWFSRFSGVV